MGIINSLLDTDQYIYTMAQAALHQAPGAMVKFKFKCRNFDGHVALDGNEFLSSLNSELDHLCTLKLTGDELAYLKGLRYFKKDFLYMLKDRHLDRDLISAYKDTDGKIAIDINGPIFLSIWFEVPVLAIVSELRTISLNEAKFNLLQEGRKRLKEKIAYIKTNVHEDSPFTFGDFGTRRRSWFSWHREVIRNLKDELPKNFIGTSNLLAAKEFGIKPLGTMAHLWFQLFQRMGVQLEKSQQAALDAWQNEYRGDLGIALSDIGGFNWFLKDFDSFFAKLFDGCRHDSGDPFFWCEMLIKHYEKLSINPKTKTALFSDGLTIPLAVKLFESFNKQINTSFGIGTHLTNDMGVEAPQIVIKMVECNDGPVAKLSDSKGKGMCEDPVFKEYFEKVIKDSLNGS